MVVAICIEVSHQRGAGHLFRAMVLAKELIRRGSRVLIVGNDCRQALEQLRAAKIEYRTAPVGYGANWENSFIAEHKVDIWINDRLDTDPAHGTTLKSLGIRLVTFDDHGEGAYYADLNVCALGGDDTGSIPGRRVLTGEEWLVLCPELARYKRQRTAPKRLLVTLGGSDTYGVTLRVVRLLLQAERTATVATGPLFAHRAELITLVAGTSMNWRSGIADMGELFYEHDMAITGGGITPFEAAATGLPVIIIANELHEIPVARRLERLGCARFAGHHETMDTTSLLSIPGDLADMSRAGTRCIPLDGAGRVCEEILNG